MGFLSGMYRIHFIEIQTLLPSIIYFNTLNALNIYIFKLQSQITLNLYIYMKYEFDSDRTILLHF